MTEEPIFVVGSRVEQLRELPTPGSTAVPCADCGEATWIGPASQRFLREHPGAVVLCVEPCAIERAGREPDIEVGLVPGVAAEFDAWKRRN